MFNSIKKFIKKNFTLQSPNTLFSKKDNGSINLNNSKILSFGELNKDKVFYIIKRTPGTGLFSNVLYVLNHLKIAKKNKYIPFVDMENFITIYNERKKINGTKNAWEYYFKNLSNYKLKEIYQSKKVIFTDNKYHSNFVYDLEKNKELMKLFKQKILINKNILNEYRSIKKKN